MRRKEEGWREEGGRRKEKEEGGDDVKPWGSGFQPHLSFLNFIGGGAPVEFT